MRSWDVMDVLDVESPGFIGSFFFDGAPHSRPDINLRTLAMQAHHHLFESVSNIYSYH